MSDAALPLSNEEPALPRLAGGRDVRLGLALKRLMDIGISAVLLVALSPLLLAIAVLVKTTSPGPAL